MLFQSLLQQRPKMSGGKLCPWVFPGRKGQSLSNAAILALLKRMERTDITAHGFRSTFRDWAAEQTTFPREVAEMALAHAVGDKVEAAYRRGDLFEKRKRLMEAWARYCATIQTKGDNVASIHQKKASSA
jgi:integrase